MTSETYKHIRINETTGEEEYFFPMEITCPEARAWAKESGFEIAKTRLGFRVFEAAMIPCKDTDRDERGRETFVETPTTIQRHRYLELIKDELNDQEDIKEDGRCIIPDGRGGTKRCPLRIPNPDYAPGNGQPKTLPVRCEGCVNEPYKCAHTYIPSSALSHIDSSGEVTPFEPPVPYMYGEGEKYLRLKNGFVEFVRKRQPELAALAFLLTEEYNKSEIAELTADPRTTIVSRAKKLMGLAREYLDNTDLI